MLITSPAIRAIETAQIIKKLLAKHIKSWTVDERLFTSDVHALSSVISQIHNKNKTLMLIGHNPDLDTLINWFLSEERHLKTSDVFFLKFNVNSWSDIFRTKKIKIRNLGK